jgi:hypothetical protein
VTEDGKSSVDSVEITVLWFHSEIDISGMETKTKSKDWKKIEWKSAEILGEEPQSPFLPILSPIPIALLCLSTDGRYNRDHTLEPTPHLPSGIDDRQMRRRRRRRRDGECDFPKDENVKSAFSFSNKDPTQVMHRRRFPGY